MIVSTLTETTPTGTPLYTGGNAVVEEYTSGAPIAVEAQVAGVIFENGNFVVQTENGAMVIENVMDKVIDLRDAAGNSIMKAYTSSTEGVVDGRGLDGFQIIAGANNGSNIIFTGDGGSQLWGGEGNFADALVGGNGVDNFICGIYQGLDNFFNVSSDDAVNLLDANLSDIVGTLAVNDDTIAIGFSSGNVIMIQSTELLSAAITLADGSSWRFNHTTKTWQTA